MLVHEYSRGIPRTVNVLSDNALLNAMALGRQPVGRDIVLDVIRDFDLRRDSTIPYEVEPAQPPLQPRQEARIAEHDNRPALRRDDDDRPPLGLEDLDAQLADPAVPAAVLAHVEPLSGPPAEPRRLFRWFGDRR